MHNNNNNNNNHQQNLNIHSANTTQSPNGKKTDRSLGTKRTMSNTLLCTINDPTAMATGPKRVKIQAQHQRLEQNSDHEQQATFLQPAAATAPQLLQQLMAPAPQNQRDRKADRSALLDETVRGDASKWGSAAGINGGVATLTSRQNSVTPAASHSVLKNLLVSGCDVSAGYVCIVPMRPKKALKT